MQLKKYRLSFFFNLFIIIKRLTAELKYNVMNIFMYTNNDIKKFESIVPQALFPYVLQDYTFMQHYKILRHNYRLSTKMTDDCMLATISNTDQLVIIHKLLERFLTLVKLFNQGIILADNIFILPELNSIYLYVIEAYIQHTITTRFHTLQQLLNNDKYLEHHSKEWKDQSIAKIKIMLDQIHLEGTPYVNFTTENIIIDDDDQIYLAPYELHPELHLNNAYIRAYYPLNFLNKGTQMSDLRVHQLIQADAWSFGCVCLQIHALASPLFMSTSLIKQRIMMENFDTKKCLLSHKTAINQLIANCLPIISSQTKTKEQQKTNLQSYKSQSYQCNILRQLNLNGHKMQGDCQLTLCLLSFLNIDIMSELRVTVYLGAEYRFYLDSQHEGPCNYNLNRKITIYSSFTQLKFLLQKPLFVQVAENQRIATFQIILQTLVIHSERSLIWKKPIIGSYKTLSNPHFSQCKLSINCQLKSTEKSQHLSLQNIQSISMDQKKPQKKSNEIYSLSSINATLSALTDHWRQKTEKQEIIFQSTSKKLQQLILI